MALLPVPLLFLFIFIPKINNKHEYPKRIGLVKIAKTTYYIGSHFETTVYSNGTEINTSYYYANGERVARKVVNGATEKKYFIHGDHLGSTSVITDESGEEVEKTKYYPYGATREGGSKEKYLFTGQERDAETGLYYYGARYYSPEVRRFVQPDSVIPDIYNPQYLNRYSYVLNNPLKYVDPTGHESTYCPTCEEQGTFYDSLYQYQVQSEGDTVSDLVWEVLGGADVVNFLEEPSAGNAFWALTNFPPTKPLKSLKFTKAGDKAADASKAGDETADASKATDKASDAGNADKGADASKQTKVTGEELQKKRAEFENTVKPEYWKQEAAKNPDKWSKQNLELMKQGKAPYGSDGKPMVLHHKKLLSEGGTNDFSNLEPMTMTEHLENFGELHARS